jgi:RND family efflux transporter MFP subunit
MLANPLPLIIAALAFSLTSLNAIASQPEALPASISNIKTQLSKLESRPSYIDLEAKLEAIKQSTISAQTTGIVEMINFDINDGVEAGQVLIIINSSQQQASLSQAKAAQAQAQALNNDAQVVLKRHRSLLAKKTLSQGEFDTSLARANSSHAAMLSAKSQVTQAQEQVAYTRITAPYSGIVRQRFVQVGELVTPGQAVMTGFAMKPLRAVVDIPQSLAAKLSVQYDSQQKLQANPIYIVANNDRYLGTQLVLFPYADSRYSSIRARINVAETDDAKTDRSNSLIPGTWVQVQLPIGQQQGIYLPASAILQQGEVASIYVLKNDAFKLRYVRLGQVQHDTQIRIVSGLEAGEIIAIDAIAAAKSQSKTAAATTEAR